MSRLPGVARSAAAAAVIAGCCALPGACTRVGFVEEPPPDALVVDGLRDGSVADVAGDAADGPATDRADAPAPDIAEQTDGVDHADLGVDLGADVGPDLDPDAADLGVDLGPDVGPDLGPDLDPWVPPEEQICSVHHWCWEHPAPLGGSLRAIWVGGADDVWVGGKQILAHFDGTAWSQPLRSERQVLAVWGSAGSDVYAVSYGADVLHFDGSSWDVQLAGDADLHLFEVWGLSADAVYVAGYHAQPTTTGRVLRADGQGGFTPLPSAGDQPIYGLWGSSESDLFAVGNSGAALRFDGTSWAPLDLGVTCRLEDIWGSGPDDVYVNCSSKIHRYDGTTWEVQSTPGFGTARGLWGSGPDDVYVGKTLDGDLIHFDGSAWSAIDLEDWPVVQAIHGAGQHVFTAGSSGHVHRFDGSAWTLLNPGTRSTVNAVWGTGQTLFAAADNGGLLRTTGTAWQTLASGTVYGLKGIWGRSASEVIAVGDKGTMLRFDGTSWAPTASGTTSELKAVWLGPQSLVAVGRTSLAVPAGTLVRHVGSTVDEQPFDVELRAVWGAGDDAVWTGGYDGRIWRFDGTAWGEQSTPTTELVNGLWGRSASDVYAVARGVVLGYDGSSWSLLHEDPPPYDINRAVHGAPNGDLLVVGAEIRFREGTSWRSEPTPLAHDAYGVWRAGTQWVVVGSSGGVVRHYP